jgi:hypothetical protein
MAATATTPSAKRRWLTFSLRSFLVATLVVGLIAAYAGRSWWQAVQARTPPTPQQLAALAKRLGLPMPPDDAPLVLVCTFVAGETALYEPAFLLKRNDDGTTLVLRGWEEETASLGNELDHPQPALIREYRHDAAPDDEAWAADTNNEAAFVCALQLIARGDMDRGMQLLSRYRESFSPDGDPQVERRLVADCAYAYVQRQLAEAPERWPELHDRLDTLIREFPHVDEGGGQATTLLEDLEAALSSKPPTAGSVEALLVEWSLRPCNKPYSSQISLPYNIGEDTPKQRLLLRGVEALPELVRLVADRRLTTHYRWMSQENTQRRMLRLGDLADEVLRTMTGAEATWKRKHEAWDVWLKRVDRADQLGLLRRAAFSHSLNHLYAGPLFILSQRYPHELREVLHEYLQKQRTPRSPMMLAGAIAQAVLPADERLALLELLLADDVPDRGSVLPYVSALDRKRAISHAMCLLDQLPRLQPERFSGPDRVTQYTDFVVTMNDEQLWRRYLEVSRRCSPAARIELIAYLLGKLQETRHDRFAKAYLASFLDDEATANFDIGSYISVLPGPDDSWVGTVANGATRVLRST